MSNNGPVKIEIDSNLAQAGSPSNVATKQAETEALKQANVDGKSIRPEWVTARGLDLAESLRIGSGVSITDGTITGDMIAANTIDAGHIDATAGITTTDIQFTGGTLSGFGISTLGSISAGSLAIGDEGVTIGSAGNHLYIGGNMLIAYDTGDNPTITIDGTTGIVTCTKLVATLDGTSSMNLTAASITIGGNTSVDGTTTVTTIKNTATTANGTANTALSNAATALSTAQGRLLAGGGVVEDGSHYITRINTTSGIVVSTATADSGARTQMTSAGIAIYNSAATLIVQADHTNGVFINNANTTPGLTERLSLAYGGSEQMWIGAGSTWSGMTEVGGRSIRIATGSYIWLDSTTVYCTGNDIVLGTNDNYPVIQATGAPSQGAASGLPYGSLRLATGGSLWIVDGSGNWDRIYGKSASAATAHTG